ncbi:chemotaxis protein CheW [Undibacter mobilis]|uniref:Chemotaxis protein CheW n=1 Tax=Undibacter mobilis TaxID=2292256 RepID=A0A371BCS6_9BRAD|nr:chemotaxis protein CheW [Undibacter mobilis]RDV05368.1 chemotaxis protein CheW [Undibacter mobilis]
MTQIATSPPVTAQPVASATTAPLTEAAAGASNVTEFISFAIGEEQYGVDIMAVREIKGWSDITHLPKQPDYVRGVLNLRGAIVPIVDLRCRFGQGLTETSPLHIVIIVQIGDRQVGLIGDRVLDIVSVTPAQIQQVPRTSHTHSTNFLAGLVSNEDVMIALIDLPNLLADHNGIDSKTIVLDA